MKPSETLARNVKSRRTAKRMSQGALSEAMNRLGHDWTPNVVSQVEANRRRVYVDELPALAAVLGYVFNDLLVPADEFDRLDIGAAELRPAFVHHWTKGDVVLLITWDEDGNPQTHVQQRVGAQVHPDVLHQWIEWQAEGKAV